MLSAPFFMEGNGASKAASVSSAGDGTHAVGGFSHTEYEGFLAVFQKTVLLYFFDGRGAGSGISKLSRRQKIPPGHLHGAWSGSPFLYNFSATQKKGRRARGALPGIPTGNGRRMLGPRPDRFRQYVKGAYQRSTGVGAGCQGI